MRAASCFRQPGHLLEAEGGATGPQWDWRAAQTRVHDVSHQTSVEGQVDGRLAWLGYPPHTHTSLFHTMEQTGHSVSFRRILVKTYPPVSPSVKGGGKGTMSPSVCRSVSSHSQPHLCSYCSFLLERLLFPSKVRGAKNRDHRGERKPILCLEPTHK